MTVRDIVEITEDHTEIDVYDEGGYFVMSLTSNVVTNLQWPILDRKVEHISVDKSNLYPHEPYMMLSLAEEEE